MIARLKREGLATSKLYRGVFLTPEGHNLAERVRSRHRLVVDVLRAVGVPEQCAELDAEGMEHHVSDVALADLCAVSETRQQFAMRMARFEAKPERKGRGVSGPQHFFRSEDLTGKRSKPPDGTKKCGTSRKTARQRKKIVVLMSQSLTSLF